MNPLHMIAATITAGLIACLIAYAMTHAADWLDDKIAAHFIHISSGDVS
jgi:Flp pilus assembly pilin Flp